MEPWIIFAASGRNEVIPDGLQICGMLPPDLAIKYELLVLLSRAQPIWPLLLKVKVLHTIIILQTEGKM